jgi:hypothetical protein
VRSLIKAHAILHQATRERDTEGRLIATLDDYNAVRELVGEVVSEAVEGTVSAATKETVKAVNDLHKDHPDGVSIAHFF